MSAAARQRSALALRAARAADVPTLLALEDKVFATDRISRRSLRRFIDLANAAFIVGDSDGAVSGYALVLFRPRSEYARLYSIAVDPRLGGRGIGWTLLAAAERAAAARGCVAMRLEVNARNTRAVRLYERSGYRQFALCPGYYQDGGTALRFEKRLQVDVTKL